jgi:hypothetical protein
MGIGIEIGVGVRLGIDIGLGLPVQSMSCVGERQCTIEGLAA